VLYKRVLLLEDNKMNQRVATELLESAGVIATLANHGGVDIGLLAWLSTFLLSAPRRAWRRFR
jgi:CheY-like chemotaxis protein